jgi:DNA-binding transcriptional LysR family regulator
MDWEDLHYFVVFAREKSLSAAARKLNVDHVTVARRVAALEASLDRKLVDRRPRTYTLTTEGERIAALGGRIEEETLAIGRSVRGSQQELAGEVSVSAPPLMSTHIIGPRLGGLHRKHPRIHLLLIGETRMASLHRETDLAIRLSRPTGAQLVCRKIGTVHFALYASPEYLADRHTEAFEYIGYDQSMEDSGQQLWLKANAGRRPIVFRSNNLETQWAAARAGMGIAALPAYLGDKSDDLQPLEGSQKKLERAIWLAVHRDMRRAPTIRVVMDFIVACFA